MQKKRIDKDGSSVNVKESSVRKKKSRAETPMNFQKIRVKIGRVKPLNVLDLKKLANVRDKDEGEEILKARELSFNDCFANLREFSTLQLRSGQANNTNDNMERRDNNTDFLFYDKPSKINKLMKLLINLLVSLPGDFFYFYRRLFGLLFGIIQWTLEEVGRAPFKVFFGTLSLIENYIARPILKIIYRILAGGWYFIRYIGASIVWIAKTGLETIFSVPGQFFMFLKPAPVAAWRKNILAFVIVCLILVLPFGAYTHLLRLKATEGTVLGVAAAAYEYLQEAQTATQALDFGRAQENFKKAGENFEAAQNEIDGLNFLIEGIIKTAPKGAAAEKILEAGRAMSEAGAYLTGGLGMLALKNNSLAEIETNEDGMLEISNKENDPVVLGAMNLGLAEKLEILEKNFALAYPKIILARKNLEAVDPNILPEENLDNFLAAKRKVIGLEMLAKKLVSFMAIINELLAIDANKRFLVIFQNETELRPTGGFLGSLALLDIKNGEIKQIEIPGGGPYDLRGSLVKRVAPPEPLRLINDQWQIQDANWFPDFLESAKKIAWFYENSGGATVDGVIAITSGLIPNLLEITGPIEMPEYGKVIDKDNFYLETQLAVEVEYDKEENKPKKFIADLTPKILDKIIKIPSDKLINLLGAIDLGLAQKQVMFYFADVGAQAEAEKNNWAGRIRETGENDDYLMVVNTNIAGGKTDGVINEKIVHETEIADDGQIFDTVTIIRRHDGGPGDFFANQRNADYLRVYAPAGSTLLEAKGFMPRDKADYKELAADLEEDEDLARIENNVLVDDKSGTRITNEFGKTVFGNWILVDPGQTVICKFKYRLPWRVSFALVNGEPKENLYALLIQKQAGSREDIIEKIINLPGEAGLAWKYPEADFVGEYKGMAKFRSGLDGDKYYGILFR